MPIRQMFKDAKDALIADEGTRSARTEICKVCPYFKIGTSRCGICGCFIKAKTALNRSKCPKSKW